MRKYICLCCTILIGLLIAACSNEEKIEQIDFDNLQFVVNITTNDHSSMNKVKSKANSKNGWVNNDCIYMSADGSDNNIYKIKYNGSDWNVDKVIQSAKFNNTTGKINAVFSNNSKDNGSDEINIEGDILYTEEGNYIIEDNIVFINLKMDKRPIVRIEVKGIDEGYSIVELENYSAVKLSNLNWIKNNEQYYGKKEGESIVYYGILPKDVDGNYTITLKNTNGDEFIRTYKGKNISEGDYIIINGPNSEEKDEWHQKVTGINAIKEEIQLPLNSTGNITDLYQIIPNTATNQEVNIESSNSSVVKINNDGTYTTKGIGESVITIKTDEGGFTCQTKVFVKKVSDLVSITLTGTSTTMSNLGMSYGREYTITNKADRELLLVSLSTSNTQTINKKIGANSSLKQWLYFNYNVYPTVSAIVKFGNDEYEIKTE